MVLAWNWKQEIAIWQKASRLLMNWNEGMQAIVGMEMDKAKALSFERLLYFFYFFMVFYVIFVLK